jgi:hypothetical protein
MMLDSGRLVAGLGALVVLHKSIVTEDSSHKPIEIRSRRVDEITMKLIPLTRGKFAMIDDEDFENISKSKWYAHLGDFKYRIVYYAYGYRNNKDISMHQHLLDSKPGEYIDHIDGNGLNNQRSNLRIITNRGNQQNLHYKKASKYPGVSWHKSSRKWSPKIQINGTRKHLGTYTDEFTAFKVYVVANVVLL